MISLTEGRARPIQEDAARVKMPLQAEYPSPGRGGRSAAFSRSP
jgi:hypothetical protein